MKHDSAKCKAPYVTDLLQAMLTVLIHKPFYGHMHLHKHNAVRRATLEARQKRVAVLQRRTVAAAAAAQDDGKRLEDDAANMQRLDALRQARTELGTKDS